MGLGHADAKDSCQKCGGKVLLIFYCYHGIRELAPRTPAQSAAERYSLFFLNVVTGSVHEDAKDFYPKFGGKVLLVFSVVMGCRHEDAKNFCPKCGGKVRARKR
jgi:hypothetical protein